ncbi:MAG: zinc ribbon domain-containing protein [Planctomycetota bacterium]
MARRSRTARFRARKNAEGENGGPTPSSDPTKGGPGARAPRTAGSSASRSGPSSRSSLSRGRASREQGAAQPRVGRDGKVQIACPNCQAAYRLMPEHMDSKVKCTQCHRVFFPGAATGGKRSSHQKSPATPIIAFSAAVVIIVLIGVLIANAGGEAPRPEPVEEPKYVALGNSTPQVKAVKRWANGIFQNQRYEVENFTAFTPVQELLGIDPEHKYNHSFGDAQRELGKKIIDALLTGEQAGIFQYCEARSGKIMDAAYLTATKGKISLSVMEPKKQREGTVIIDYVEEADGTFKVAGWEVVSAPKRPLSDAELAALRGKRFKVHPKIPKPKVVKKMFGGKEIEITESELVPLGHLEDTPPELRKKIDEYIAHLMDHSDPRRANRAQLELLDIGKPAVPRLLNKMYEVKPKGRDDVEALNRVVKTVRLLSGQAFGYNPRELIGQNVGGSEKERESALKQWYGWWYYMHASGRWDELVDQEDEEFMTEEEIKAKRAAERKAKRDAAREALRKKRGR